MNSVTYIFYENTVRKKKFSNLLHDIKSVFLAFSTQHSNIVKQA